MVDPATISAGASVVGAIGGLFGKKKKNVSVPTDRTGFQTLNDIPFFRRNATTTELLPEQFEDALQTDYFSRPTRRLTEMEMNDDIFAPKAVMDFKNFFDSEKTKESIGEGAAPEAMDYRKLGSQYVDSYLSSPDVNQTFENTIRNRGMDFEQVGKMLMDIKNNPDTFQKNEAALRGLGLGYMPKALPTAIGMPTRGIAGYN